MRWLLLGLLTTVIGAALILLVSADSGYIIISIGPYTLEMSFWFGLAALVVIYFLWKQLYKLFNYVRDLLAGSVSWISESRARRIERRTSKGLLYFIEGNWRPAKKELLAAAKLEKKPLLQYLAAANSALELGQEEETRFLLQQAENIAPENERAILLTHARLEIHNRNYQQALGYLKRAAELYPYDEVVLKLLKLVYLQLHSWSSLLDLLPKLKADKDADKEELKRLEVEAWRGQTEIALDKAIEMQAQPLSNFESIWKGLPTDIRSEPALVALYAKKLIQNGYQEKALDVLGARLKANLHGNLLFLYGSHIAKDKKQQLMQAETWLREYPGDADLLFVLGKLARANELWGKAKEYFGKSLILKPSPHCYAELAGLLAQLGDHEESVECYRKGLLLSSS